MIYILGGIVASGLMLLYRRAPVDQSPLSHPSLRRLRQGGGDRVAAIVAVVGSAGVLIAISALRHGPGTDYWRRYVPLFERVRFGVPVDTERGFLLLNQVVAALTSDYQWLFAVMAVLTVGLVYRFILRMSLNPAMSVFVYAFGGTYLESFNLVRQGLAIAIVLNTIELIERRRPVPFFLLTLLASSLHSSALLWLAVWPIVRLRGGTATRVALLGGMVLAILAAPAALTALIDRVAPGYSWYFDSNYGGVQAFDSSVLWIAIVVLVGTLVLLKGRASETTYVNGVINLQAVQVATLLATVTVAYAFSRLSYYFTPIQMLAVPLLLAAIQDRRTRHLVTAGLIVAYAAAFYVRFIVWNAHEVMPYESIFSR